MSDNGQKIFSTEHYDATVKFTSELLDMKCCYTFFYPVRRACVCDILLHLAVKGPIL